MTGANGFIGRALCAELRHRGQPVRACYRRREADAHDEDVVVIGDIGRDTDWSSALAGVDVVVHLAGRVHKLRDGHSDPLAAFRTVNTEGSLCLARQAAACGVRRLVFMSSLKVLGATSPPGHAFTEANPANPADPYALSKHEAEQGLREIGRQCGLQTVIIRPPLVYGPGVKANFSLLAGAVQRGWPLPLGQVANRRSLISVDNLVDFTIACITHPAAADEVFLVSDGVDVSTAELVRALARATGAKPRLLNTPLSLLRLGARLTGSSATLERLCDSLQVDIGKARHLLGWTPRQTLDEALAQMTAAERAAHA